ncbi:MAG: SPASM domain-containing protein, partial [Candidatus Aenigmatarchaeota archaeon]
GEATFCCMIENSPENIKEKSLREIWFGKYFDQQRRNFINKVVREECKFCVFTQFVKNREIRRKLSSNFS